MSLCLKPFWRSVGWPHCAGTAAHPRKPRTSRKFISRKLPSSLSQEHTGFLFGDQENRRAAGGDRHCICDRLFAAVRCGARLQSLYGWEMDLCNAMGKRCTLRGISYFARHNFGLAGQLLDRHGHMLVLVHALEGFGVCRTRVNYDQLSASLNLLKIKVFVSVNTR